MFFFEDSLGIEISESSLRCTIIGKSLKHYHILDSMAVSLESGDDENPEEKIVAALQEFIERTGFKPGRVLLGIPRKHAILRFLNLPILPTDEINNYIRFEADRHVPLELDRYWYDTQIVEEKLGTGMQVLFVAIPAERIEFYLSILEKASLSPDVVDIAPFNSINVLFLNGLIDVSNGLDVVVRPDLYTIDVILLHKGKIVFSRSIAVDDSNGQQSDYQQLHGEIIEQIRLSLAVSGFTAQGQNQISHVFITSARDGFRQLGSLLQQEFSTKVTFIEKYDSLVAEDEVKQRVLNDSDESVSIGLALRSYGQVPMKMNLLPKKRRPIHKQYGLWISMSLIACIVVSMLTWLIFAYYQSERVVEQLKIQTQALQPRVEKINSIRDEIKQVRELMKLIDEKGREKTLKLDVLADLTSRLPAEYWLNYFLLAEDKLTIHGEGPSPENLIQILDDSPFLESVKLERVVNDRFTIAAQFVQPEPPQTEEEGAEVSPNGNGISEVTGLEEQATEEGISPVVEEQLDDAGGIMLPIDKNSKDDSENFEKSEEVKNGNVEEQLNETEVIEEVEEKQEKVIDKEMRPKELNQKPDNEQSQLGPNLDAEEEAPKIIERRMDTP